MVLRVVGEGVCCVLHEVERRERQRLRGLVPGEPEAVDPAGLVQRETGEGLQPVRQRGALALSQEKRVAADPPVP
jgi:hypothetical protein